MEELNKKSIAEVKPESAVETNATFRGVEYLTLRQAAEYLKPFFTLGAIRQRAAHDNLPFPIQQIGRKWYCKRSDLDAYLNTIM